MAATTISRATWTDGTSGTVINNARLQADVYDKVDALLAANITFGGTVSAEGFGTHAFSAGGSGGNIFGVRNTTSGTTNYGMLRVGNNSAINTGEFFATSSAFTPAADELADCLCIRGNGAGGISIAAVNASGQVRFYAGSTPTERVRITTSGLLIAPSGSFPSASASDMLVLAGATPQMSWYESDQGADGKWWVNAVSSGSWILQTENDALSGAATAISILRSGNTISTITVGGALLGTDGAVGAPSHSFSNETNSGLYRSSSGHISVAVTGVQVVDINRSYFTIDAPCIRLPDAAAGTGPQGGGSISIGRNSSGSGAAGTLQLASRTGSLWPIWSDAGTLRIASLAGAFPTENDLISHTGGTIVGTQTSSRDSKIVLGSFEETASALDLVRRIPLYRWRYRHGSQALQDEEFIGVITDETPEFGMDRDEAHPGGKSLNVPSAIGYLIAAVQEQQRMIETMQGKAA